MYFLSCHVMAWPCNLAIAIAKVWWRESGAVCRLVFLTTIFAIFIDSRVFSVFYAILLMIVSHFGLDFNVF